MEKILFVCLGNVRRSPMAEGIFNAMVKNRKIKEYMAFSRGLQVKPGSMIEPMALESLESCACDEGEEQRRCIQLEEVDVEEAERVYCMTREIQDMMVTKYPKYADKICTVASYDITDPHDGTKETYRKCRSELVDAVFDIVTELVQL